MSKLDRYTWRYLPRCRVTHALTDPRAYVAQCGVAPAWFLPGGVDEWRGTGSQVEYDNAAAYPRCKRCVALIERSA